MKYFSDTEFLERGPEAPVHLLSLAIVSEDGRELYVVNQECPVHLASDWVKENVLPHIDWNGINVKPLRECARDVRAFIEHAEVYPDFTDRFKPEFWGYYADYDWVCFAQMFGTMMDLPKGYPKYCGDIKQLCDMMGNPQLPEQTTTEHHALLDARWTRDAYYFLESMLHTAGLGLPLVNWTSNAPTPDMRKWFGQAQTERESPIYTDEWILGAYYNIRRASDAAIGHRAVSANSDLLNIIRELFAWKRQATKEGVTDA